MYPIIEKEFFLIFTKKSEKTKSLLKFSDLCLYYFRFTGYIPSYAAINIFDKLNKVKSNYAKTVPYQYLHLI